MPEIIESQPERLTPTLGGVLGEVGVDGAGRPIPKSAPTLVEARAYLDRLATGHYENFSVLSRLVPRELRDDFAAVYGFCRWSDDLADETGEGASARQRSLDLLAWWRGELDSCFAFARDESVVGVEPPRHPVFVALVETIRSKRLAPEPFHHLIDAFEQDQRKTRYQTWDEVIEYCVKSADPVGRIVLALAGHTGDQPGDADRVRMSDATCTALQLTNHWQDVQRDLVERDRVYLPSDETGMDAEVLREMLERPNDSAARVRYIRAVRPLVEKTRAKFKEGRPLPGTLDRSIRPVVRLFGAGGEAVLDRIERVGCATLWERPTLHRSTKLWLVGLAGARSALARLGR